MRRARISIKPNVRPGGRSGAPAAADKSSQESAAVGSPQQTNIEEQTDRPTPPPDSQLEVIEPAVAMGDGNIPDSPSEKASVNTRDGAPSSASKASTSAQRRSRISATPNLARPKLRSVTPSSTGKIPEAPVPVAISIENSQTSTLSDSIDTQNTTTPIYPPSSPCLPSTSGLHEPSAGKTSIPESPSSTRSEQWPHQTLEDSGLQDCSSPSSQRLSPYVKLSRFDDPGSPLKNSDMISDKQRVLRALKLKELMKLERKKEREERKSRRPKRECNIVKDRSKMTIGDFIYYLPEDNPMKSSLSTEDQGETVVPPSPKVPETMAQAEEEDEEDDADEEMVVPKVRVAEDGTLILDEDSLTVRVQRMSDTVVENATPLFERGNTTTYNSFKAHCPVKSWSVRETDMFFLAISMVGTDFTMIAQLFPHRTRKDIKRKFKKEEKINSWRVDKAFSNKRPYDQEFFSFLLKRVLEKDKKKGRAIKLVVKHKKKKGKGGKKAKQLEDEDVIDIDDIDIDIDIDDDDDDDISIVDSTSLDLEKENEDSSNVRTVDELSDTTKKRKRTRNTKREVEKTRRPRDNKKKSNKKGKCSGKDKDTDLLLLEDDMIEEDPGNENEDESHTSIPKKKRKCSKKGAGESQEEEAEKRRKPKRKKKAPKVQKDELLPTDGETGEDNLEQMSTTPKKKRKCFKKSEKEEEEAGKGKTKKTKISQEESAGDELGTDGIEAGSAAEEDQGEKLIPETAAQEESPVISSKRFKKRLPNKTKRKAKKCSEPEAVEIEDTTQQETQEENCSEADGQLRINCLANEKLQKQAVVVLERTPPRLKKTDKSENQEQPPTSQSSQGSPRQQTWQTRAEKVKRNLTASREELKEGNVEDFKDGSESETSPEDMSQESKEMERDQPVNEWFDHHVEFLSSSKVNGHMLLKRPVILVSNEEVERYLRSQAQTAEEKPPSLKSLLDVPPVEGESVGEHEKGLEKKGSSSVHLEERDSQDSEIKEPDSTTVFAQQCVQKRSRFTKPLPNISRAAATSHRPLSVQSTEPAENSASDAQMSDVTDASAPPERHSAITTEVLGASFSEPLDLKDQDRGQTTVDHLPSFESEEETPRECKKIDQEILSTQVLPTALTDKDLPETETNPGSSWTIKNTDQISDQEKCDSGSSEPEDQETETEEPQTELKRTVSASCVQPSADGSSGSTQHDTLWNRFCVPLPELEWESKAVISPQKTAELNEDATIIKTAEKAGLQSPAKAQSCDFDSNMENVSREDELEASEVNLQDCKQAEDFTNPLQSLSPTQILDPIVLEDNASTGDHGKSDPVLSDTASTPSETHILGSFFSEPLTKHPGNKSDLETMLFCETTAEDVHVPDSFGEAVSLTKNQSSEEPESTENQSEEEDYSAPLEGNANSEVLDSAEVETSATSSTDMNTDPEKLHAEINTVNDNQTEEEPTFILTLYEIPSSQLFVEAAGGHQDMASYDLEPAQVETPLLFSDNSQSLPSALEASSSALFDMESEGNEKPCLDDSTIPISEDAEKAASPELTSPQESSLNLDSLISPPESQEVSMPTDVTDVLDLSKSDLKPKESPETKAVAKRRSKIKVKPKLRPFMKVGASKTDQSDCESNQQPSVKASLPTSHQARAQQAEMEFNQKTSVQETFGAAVSSEMPVSKKRIDEIHVERGSLQMSEDSIVDPLVVNLADIPGQHSPVIKESDEVQDGCEGVSHLVLVDAKMEDVDMELQKSDDLSECLPESEISFPAAYDQKENMEDISDQSNTSTSVTPASQEKTMQVTRRGQTISPEPQQVTEQQIKEESDEVELGSEQDDFSDKPKSESDAELTPAEDEVTSTEPQRSPFTAVKTSIRSESTSVEEETKDGHKDISHMVLTDIFVPVSDEMENEVQMEKGSSLQSDLSRDWSAPEERRPNKAERSLVKVHPDISNILHDDTQKSDSGSSRSPNRKKPKQSKVQLKVKMMFPKRKSMSGDTLSSPKTEHPKVELSSEDNATKDSAPLESKHLQLGQQSPQSSVKEILTCTDLPPIDSEDAEDACEGDSDLVLADVSVPAFEKSIVSKSNSERKGSTNTAERKPPSCRRAKLQLKSKLPKRKDEPSETDQSHTDLSQPSAAQNSAATPQRSLEPGEEWSLKTNMLPVDSDEIENWCEGVSHMLMSDAFVPVSEGTEEDNSTNWNVVVANSPQKDNKCSIRLSETEGTPSENANEVHQLDSISAIPKIEKLEEKLPTSPGKQSPEGRGTFQMTLRSPQRTRLKDEPDAPKSTPTSPQPAKTSVEKQESIRTPNRQQTEVVTGVCRIHLERLSSEEIYLAQKDLQPRHHSTPINVNKTSGGNGEKAFLPLDRGSSSHESCADQKPPVSSDYWPRVVLHNIKVESTVVNTTTPTSSPARTSTTASQQLTLQESPQDSPLIASVDGNEEPAQVSQFFLGDVFTEVVDPD